MSEIKMYAKFQPEYSEGKRQSEDEGLREKIILKWMLRKQGVRL
jgi:hypothetical protein